MAKTERLTALKLAHAKVPGYYADGGGLYLQVTVNSKDRESARSWIYRYMLRGRAREMGLGSANALSLREAREKARMCRRLRQEGIDPIDHREDQRGQAALEAAKTMTFRQCAEAYIEAHRTGWRNAKHVAQWHATLDTYAHPVIGNLPVQKIDTALVVNVLEPIWRAKPETASRLRGRIERVLDWARVAGFRQAGENPARWGGHLEEILPPRAKVRAVKHHAALPYPELPSFIAALRSKDGTAARALEFTILVAARTGETIGARWSEIDLSEKVWTIPAGRMKGGKEHRVPLAGRALAIVKKLAADKYADDEFVFPRGKAGTALSNMAMAMTLRRMGRGDLTVHGFRSTFRDWAAERTNFPSEAVEMALAHAVSDKVEAAYRRGELLEKRRRLMDAWARYCGMPASSQRGNVVAMQRRR